MEAKGLKSGVGEAVAGAELSGVGHEEGEQLDLLGLPRPTTNRAREIVERHAGPGRPQGSRNKMTEHTAQYLLKQYRDPRAVLLQIAQTPVEVLVSSLKCTPIQALQEKRLAAIGVLPYVAKKQPLDVNLEHHKSFSLTIIHGDVEGGDEASKDDDLSIAYSVIQTMTEENDA
jgi:hypothetical protein